MPHDDDHDDAPRDHDPTAATCPPDVRMDKIRSARHAILQEAAYIDRTIDRTIERIQTELDPSRQD